MSTLLLRFAAPLQAWGTESKYNIRKTYRKLPKTNNTLMYNVRGISELRDA